MYTCPVCGYNELQHPPENWIICPCCMTKFGYSDVSWGVDLLRQEWIQAGAKWGSRVKSPPEYWSPVTQLLNIGYEVSDADKVAIAGISDNVVIAPLKFEGEEQMQIIETRPKMFIPQRDIVIRLGIRQRPQYSDGSLLPA